MASSRPVVQSSSCPGGQGRAGGRAGGRAESTEEGRSGNGEVGLPIISKVTKRITPRACRHFGCFPPLHQLPSVHPGWSFRRLSGSRTGSAICRVGACCCHAGWHRCRQACCSFLWPGPAQTTFGWAVTARRPLAQRAWQCFFIHVAIVKSWGAHVPGQAIRMRRCNLCA